MRKIRHFFLGRLFPCALVFALLFALTVGLAVYLPRALAPLAALERVFALAAALLVALSAADAACKTGQLTLIVLLPWTGAIICLFARRPKLQTKIAPTRGVFSDTVPDRLGATVSSQCACKPCFAKNAEYFPTGTDFMPALIRAISQAKRFIWLEYYIVSDGKFWNAVKDALTERARCGVDVRLVYDDFGCALSLPKRYPRELARQNIQARVAKRLRPLSPIASNVRDHRKCAIIDGETVFLGGINLADEYIGELIRYGHWKDTTISLTGAPALAFAREYAAHWDMRDKATMLKLLEQLPAQNGEIPCIPALDRGYGAGIIHLANIAKSTLYFCTPYLAPDSLTCHALASAAEAGVDVRIMIPHIPDKRSVFLLTRRFARKLIKSGVAVREYTAGFLHAKSVTADGEICAVTSHNLDYRSLILQRECGAFLFSRELTGKIERDFLDLWEAGSNVPDPKPFERAVGAILSLFTPIF
ncbi:MAG: phosphatidylserine/phosphatidylglycerophosphate/cardiolipin synthase family protein [Clostridiales bacterium]|nr:phosphatidylserine/phosphatidylglycerophosphate/cardiolipin synthase family protein [Clostridiales bacterium]